jgi:hypothetical protein
MTNDPWEQKRSTPPHQAQTTIPQLPNCTTTTSYPITPPKTYNVPARCLRSYLQHATRITNPIMDKPTNTLLNKKLSKRQRRRMNQQHWQQLHLRLRQPSVYPPTLRMPTLITSIQPSFHAKMQILQHMTNDGPFTLANGPCFKQGQGIPDPNPVHASIQVPPGEMPSPHHPKTDRRCSNKLGCNTRQHLPEHIERTIESRPWVSNTSTTQHNTPWFPRLKNYLQKLFSKTTPPTIPVPNDTSTSCL